MNGQAPGVDPREAIADATSIFRNETMLTADADGEVMMMNVETGTYFALDDIGSEIWRRLESPCSFGELVDELATKYSGDRVEIARDVRALLNSMIARNVVTIA
jgi:hypothetical protein